MAEVSDDAKKPWDRLPVENDESWEAFQNYVLMAPDERKITLAAPRRTAVLSKWYREHEWERRVHAWDAEFGRMRHEEREAIFRRKAREIAIDHMLILSDVKDLLAREFSKLNAASRSSEMHGLLKPAEMNKMLEIGIKLDRLVRGETTENVGSTDLDMTKLSLDELDELDRLMSKAGMKKA